MYMFESIRSFSISATVQVELGQREVVDTARKGVVGRLGNIKPLLDI
jgi:hypothetical protein